jgi:hypothetical protein
VAKKEKPVAKASLNTASKPTTSSSQGVPSGAAPEKTKKSSKVLHQITSLSLSYFL